MKKLFGSLILACFILFNVSALANDGQLADKTADFSMLQSLGIFDGTEIKGDEEEISRAQFAVCVYNLFCYQNQSTAGQFIDVPKEHFASNAVNTLYELRLVSGVSSEFFAPDSPISVNEAIKILISGLGYGNYAELNGGYPMGYYSAASSLKILPKGSGDAPVNAKSLVYILKNTLKAAPVVSEGVSDTQITYGEDDESIGEKNFGLHDGEGVVTELVLAGYNEEISNKVIINNTEYDTGTLNAFDLIGRKIEFWYSQPEDGGRGTILSVWEDDSCVTVTFDAQDIISYAGGEYVYSENEKSHSKKIKSSAAIYYNGKAVPYSEDLMWPAHGSVSLVNYGSDYSAVIISSYVNGYAGRIDKDDSRIMLDSAVGYKKVENGQVKDASAVLLDAEEGYFFLYNKAGEKKEFKSLIENTIVSIYFDPYGEGMQVFYNSGVISGTVSKVEEDSITVNDKDYDIFYEMIDKSDVYAGMEGIFALDYKGNIVYVTTGKAAGDGDAFFVRAYIDEDADEKVWAVLVDIGSQKQVTYQVKKDVIVDNKKYTVDDAESLANFVSLFKSTFNTSQTLTYSSLAFMRYKTDPNGAIAVIDTINSPKYPDFKKINTYEAGINKLLVNTTLNTIGDKVLYNDNTIFADVPYTLPENEIYLKDCGQMVNIMDKYMMASNSQVGAYVDVYYFDDSDIASLIVKHSKQLTEMPVQEGYMTAGSYTDFGMFIGYSKVVDESGEVSDKIKFVDAQDGIEKEYVVMSAYSSESNGEFSLLSEGIENGDVFAYNVQNGYAGNFVKVYDCSNAEPMSALIGAPYTYAYITTLSSKTQAIDELTATSGKYNTTYRITVGRAKRLNKNVLSVALGNTTDDSNLAYFNIDPERIITYDSEENKSNRIKKGTIDDIKTLDYFGANEASKLGVYIKSGRTVTLFIYN